MFTHLRTPLLVMLMLAAGPAAARGQTDVATISGRITDDTDQPLSAVDVRALNVNTGLTTAVTSNADGIYVLQSLRPGPYHLTIARDGFRTIVLDGLAVAAQDALGRNFRMQLSPVTSVVTVAAGQQRSLSPSVGTTVDRQFIGVMPLNGRSFQSLIQLAPGTRVAPAGQGMEGQFSVNGQRTNSNYFTVDGVSANFGINYSVSLGQNLGGTLPALTIGGGTNSLVSVDAMQEFRIETSSYAPEFGRSPGAQIAIVTRSGTNEFHGTLFDYVRNDAFDARNWFNPPPQPKPPLRQHDFGATLGGPIRRSRSFFFGSYEGLRLEQPATFNGLLYTAEARAAVAPVFQPVVNAMPLPNGPVVDPACDNVTNACVAELTTAYVEPTRLDVFSIRVDQTLTPQLTLFARASHGPSSNERGFSSIDKGRIGVDLFTSGATAVISSRLVNDLRVGWARSASSVDQLIETTHGAIVPAADALFPAGGSPDRNSAGFAMPIDSWSYGLRASNTVRQLNVVDTVSTVIGAHQVKIGVDYRRIDAGGNGRSGYVALLADFSQLRNGVVNTIGTSIAEAITVRTHNWSAFVQDTWQVTPALSLTYGLRWEINTPPASITDGRPLYPVEGIFDERPVQLGPAGAPLWRTRYDDVAPRAGASYALSPSTIVRGGGGVFHDVGYGRSLSNLVAGFPYNRTRVVPAPGTAFDLESTLLVPPPISTSLVGVTQNNISAFDPNLRLPRTWQWNAAVEQALPAHQSLTLTYVGATGSGLLRPDFVSPPELRQTGTVAVLATRNAGRSRYAALQAEYRRRLSGGLQALASYTLAKTSDTESDDAGGNFFGAALNANSGVTLDAVHVPALSRSDFDVRHAAAAAVSYEIPSPGWTGAAHAIVRNWSIDAMLRASSAPPLNVRIQGVSSELGAYNTQPDVVPGQPIWLDAPGQPGGHVLNPAAFTLPAAGQPGNLVRNSIPGVFGINQTDLSLRRSFAIGSDRALEFRVDMFNVFNNAMFAEQIEFFGRCISSPCTPNGAFGKSATTLNQGLGGGGLNGGQDAIYAVGGPRSTQLSLKLRF